MAKYTKYDTHVKPHLDLVRGWKKQGVNEEEIAKRLKIAYSTFNVYKNENVELSEALKIGLDESIVYAESKLMEAIGEKNVTAILFYLKSKAGYLEEKDKRMLELKKKEVELKNKEVDILEEQVRSMSISEIEERLGIKFEE